MEPPKFGSLKVEVSTERDFLMDKKENEQLNILRHSCEHVMHQAMVELFTGLKRAMGPSTSEGFYLDFDYGGKVTEDDFPKIEKRMQEIIKADLPLIREEVSLEKAREMFKDMPLGKVYEDKDKDEKHKQNWRELIEDDIYFEEE